MGRAQVQGLHSKMPGGMRPQRGSPEARAAGPTRMIKLSMEGKRESKVRAPRGVREGGRLCKMRWTN